MQDDLNRELGVIMKARTHAVGATMLTAVVFLCTGCMARPLNETTNVTAHSWAQLGSGAAGEPIDFNRANRCVARFHERLLAGDLPPELKSQIWDAVLTAPRWFGIPVLQLTGDLVSLQEIIYDTQPDFLIETGTFMGGSSLYFATVLAQVHPTGKVLTIDVHDLKTMYPDCAEHLATIDAVRTHVDFILGNSIEPAIVRRIADRVRGRRVLVTLDSDHHAAHVLREMEAYGPLVSKESYLIVQDTYLNPRWGIAETPIFAVQQFLRTHPEFEVDHTRERYGSTAFRDGYLKRIR